MTVTYPVLTKEGLAWACKRLEEFYAIHKSREHKDLTEAVTTLREGFGLTDEVAEQYVEWVHDFIGEQYDQSMILGLLVGVMAVDNQRW